MYPGGTEERGGGGGGEGAVQGTDCHFQRAGTYFKAFMGAKLITMHRCCEWRGRRWLQRTVIRCGRLGEVGSVCMTLLSCGKKTRGSWVCMYDTAIV